MLLTRSSNVVFGSFIELSLIDTSSCPKWMSPVSAELPLSCLILETGDLQRLIEQADFSTQNLLKIQYFNSGNRLRSTFIIKICIE